MSLRFGAALCGAGFLLFCSHAAVANPAKGDTEKRNQHHAIAVRDRLKSGIVSARLTPRAASRGGSPIVGKASMYNPLEPGGYDSGGLKTASGENYDTNEWTAAIQSTLRGLFGGISFGKSYRPAYALVEAAHKRAVVKINDVGPLKPGRIIDLNKRAMRYFDPSLKRGIVAVKITPLAGYQVPGPVTKKIAS